MRIRLFAALSVLLLTTSCRSIHTVEGPFRLEDHPGKGLVIVSTRVDSACTNSAASIGLTTEDGGSAGNILFNNMFMANDFADPPGYFWAKSLDAGTYKLGYGGFGNLTTREPLGNSFTVTAGKAIYLGELTMRSQNCFSLVLSSADRWERDANLLRQKVQGVDPKDVTLSILKVR